MISFDFFSNWIDWLGKSPFLVEPINIFQQKCLAKSNPLTSSNEPIDPFEQKSPPKKNALPNFAWIGSSKEDNAEDGYHKKLFEQYLWECENLPDYRHTPEVEKILSEDSLIYRKDHMTEKEKLELDQWLKEHENNPFVKFVRRAEVIADAVNKEEVKRNALPYRRSDRALWKELPLIPGPDGRPMPRKEVKTRKEAEEKFWDFAKQFMFGLWGYRQRPYPPSRPIDLAQILGHKNLDKVYYPFIMKTGGWFYKDRLGRTRGPMELINLKTAWAAGIVDTHTFIWGEDMDEWAPIGVVHGLERAITTWEVRFAAASVAFFYKLQKGIPPWVPLKGQEKKTYKQLQEEAIESKRRDLAVMKANDGVWPGVRIPSHALGLWASGSELTEILQKDFLPNKFITTAFRTKLAEEIPGLRPWELLHVEEAMNQIVYHNKWHREPLGSYATGPPYKEYINYWSKLQMKNMEITMQRVTDVLEDEYEYEDIRDGMLLAKLAEKDAEIREEAFAGYLDKQGKEISLSLKCEEALSKN